jgi:hypothetical protein
MNGRALNAKLSFGNYLSRLRRVRISRMCSRNISLAFANVLTGSGVTTGFC